MRLSAALLVLTAATLPALAQDPAAEPLAPPPLPESVPVPEEFEPEVRIRRRGEEVIEEYRANGRLYMVKITPAAGAPYYLFDTDGDGELETFRNDLENPPLVQWRLFEW